jgi:hypothetical protein
MSANKEQSFTRGQLIWSILFVVTTLVSLCVAGVALYRLWGAPNAAIQSELPAMSDPLVPVVYTNILSFIGLALTTGLKWWRDVRAEKLADLEYKQKELELQRERLQFDRERLELERQHQQASQKDERLAELELEQRQLELLRLKLQLKRESLELERERKAIGQ